jgi:hypothetical protein
MVDLMAQLFCIVGLDFSQPITLATLFPYLCKASMAFLIVGTILSWVRSLGNRMAEGKF